MDHEELFIKRNVKAVEDSSSSPSPYASLRSQAAAQGTSLLPQRFCLAGYTVGERGEVDRKEYL